jgi:hypothetical protein
LVKQQKEYMDNNALIALRGDVLLLSFDGSWRLRYRSGDTHHHKFWGQVLRWAAANKLPNGNELVRLGTDRPVYEPDEPVVVRARLRDKNHASVTTKGASIVVREGDKEILRKQLEPLEGSAGMYSADVGKLAPGKEYRVDVVVTDPAQPDVVAAAKQVSAQIVVTQPSSLETADLSADRAALDLLAGKVKGKGIVVTPKECDNVLTVLGPPTSKIEREDRFPLWHSWYVLVGLLGLATTEWIVRKRGGLT